MLSAEELARLGDVLDGFGSPYYAAAIKLLVVHRRPPWRNSRLTVAWVDFERGEARLPDSNTGTKTVPPLSPALTVFDECHVSRTYPQLIVGGVKGVALVNLEKRGARSVRRLA